MKRELLLVIPEAHSIAPVPATLEVARKAQGAQFFRSAVGRYDVYEGGAHHVDVLRVELELLIRDPQMVVSGHASAVARFRCPCGLSIELAAENDQKVKRPPTVGATLLSW